MRDHELADGRGAVGQPMPTLLEDLPGKPKPLEAIVQDGV